MNRAWAIGAGGDDNRDAADTLAALLNICGAEVDVCHGGQQAMSLVQRKPPCHRVHRFLGMPVMDGFELARRIAAPPGR